MTEPISVLHLLPDLKTGGGQTLLLELLKVSDPHQFKHVVCHVRPEEDMVSEYRNAGIEVIHLGVSRKRHQFGAYLKLLWLVVSRKIDIVHSNNTPLDVRFAVRLCQLCRLPLVVTFHGYCVVPSPPGKRARFERLWERAKHHLTAAIAVSDPVRSSWLPHFRSLGLSNDAMVTVQPVLDVGRFAAPDRGEARRSLLQEFGLPEDSRIAVCVSRLVERKGLPDLVTALAKVSSAAPETRLIVVGDGPLRADLLEQAQDLGVASSLILVGNRADVPRILRGADIFVFASESESFGLAPCEAMAAGLPVVIFELPSLAALLSDGETAFVAPQGDSNAFVAKFRALLLDADLAEQVGARGAGRVREFLDVERSAGCYASIYQRTVAKR